MPDAPFLRSLSAFADGVEIAQGCRLSLTASRALTLRPSLHRLDIYDLSDSSAALLSGSRLLEVRSGASVLARGQVSEVFTRPVSGRSLTSISFSPGLDLWHSSVSLSLAAGLRLSDTLRALLAAAFAASASAAASASIVSASLPAATSADPAASAFASTASSSASATSAASAAASASAASAASASLASASVSAAAAASPDASAFCLAAYAAADYTFFRPQAFFGRTCSALQTLASAVSADIFLAPAGVCVSSRTLAEPTLFLPESDLLSVTRAGLSRLILTVPMLDFLPGSVLRFRWRGGESTGRVLSTLLQADNVSGPWKSELELSLL